ncbi:MAG: hypothetical protein J1G38_07710 [Clostridiales bacterium]|nr:hypothetical protein [Clostridiales bacterium]
MKEAFFSTERLKRIVESDADGEMNDTLRVAQSDIMALLGEYMDIARLDMRVDKAESGYRVTVTADADRIFCVGKICVDEGE